MGMICCYHCIDDDKLNEIVDKFKTDKEEALELIEQEEEVNDDMLDIDKMWDIIHFIFTGEDTTDGFIDDEQLSIGVLGNQILTAEDEYVAYISKEYIDDIVDALNDFNIHLALSEFTMEQGKENGLYPNIWDYEDDIYDVKEEIEDYYYMLKDFYANVQKENKNVLVTIF